MESHKLLSILAEHHKSQKWNLLSNEAVVLTSAIGSEQRPSKVKLDAWNIVDDSAVCGKDWGPQTPSHLQYQILSIRDLSRKGCCPVSYLLVSSLPPMKLNNKDRLV